MIGIIVLAVLAGWFMAAKWLADQAIQHSKLGKSRFLAFEILTVLIFIAPVTDDIIGGLQFRTLCGELAAVQTDSSRIKGKTVRSVIDPLLQEVQNRWIKIYYTHVSYRDVESGEELASYSRYTGKGGWLMHALWTGDPLTFKSTCSNASSIKEPFNRIP